jgi:hypothetical protein
MVTTSDVPKQKKSAARSERISGAYTGTSDTVMAVSPEQCRDGTHVKPL